VSPEEAAEARVTLKAAVDMSEAALAARIPRLVRSIVMSKSIG
jgi:hypothetical protein